MRRFLPAFALSVLAAACAERTSTTESPATAPSPSPTVEQVVPTARALSTPKTLGNFRRLGVPRPQPQPTPATAPDASVD
jgi:hypothetical protein